MLTEELEKNVVKCRLGSVWSGVGQDGVGLGCCPWCSERRYIEVGVRWSGNGLGVIEGTKSSKVQQSRV